MMCGTPEELRVLRWIVARAKTVAAAQKVILFGSRARGDADDRSDFDIAIVMDQPNKMSELRVECEENKLTLLAFDLVDLNKATGDFKARILAEGRDITSL